MPLNRPRPLAFPETLLGLATILDPEKSILNFRHHDSAWRAVAVRTGPWKLHLTTSNSDPEDTVSTIPPLLDQVEDDPPERIHRENEKPGLVTSLKFQPTH